VLIALVPERNASDKANAKNALNITLQRVSFHTAKDLSVRFLVFQKRDDQQTIERS
jgi:hypothetical protein